jgi:Mg2+ and Co2+ transporter CorA
MRFSRDAVAKLLASGGFFWLDLDQPDADDFEILRDVVYGAALDSDRLVEVHCFYSERFLLTVHHDDCPAFAEIRRRYQKREKAVDQPSMLLYRIIDGLVDSFFPILAAFEAPGDLSDEAPARRDAQGRLAAARHVLGPDGRHRTAAGAGRSRRALLPRHLRPPDPAGSAT